MMHLSNEICQDIVYPYVACFKPGQAEGKISLMGWKTEIRYMNVRWMDNVKIMDLRKEGTILSKNTSLTHNYASNGG